MTVKKTAVSKKRKPNTLANHEIVTLAVYLVGGNAKFVDTEDVAIKTNEIAPGRFTWRKYPTQINIENVRTSLSDAKKLKNGSLVIGSGTKGWMLSERGSEFAVARASTLRGDDLARDRSDPKAQQWIRTERARMLTSDAYEKFREGGMRAVTSQEASAFFRIDDYVDRAAQERKLVRILNSFRDDPELGDAVRKMAKKVRER